MDVENNLKDPLIFEVIQSIYTSHGARTQPKTRTVQTKTTPALSARMLCKAHDEVLAPGN